MSWLLDKKRPDGTYPFKWRGSLQTDVRETFRRVREQQPQKVCQIKPRERKA